jgi:DNA-binding IclR family transcriptional regulator
VDGRRVGVRAAERALAILALLGGRRPNGRRQDDWRLDEICTELGLPKSTVHRLLETLMQTDFVQPGSRRGTYRLGLRTAFIGAAAINVRRPSHEVRRILDNLCRQAQESIGLSIAHGREVIIIDKAAPDRLLHQNLGVGAVLPAHCSAAGKVLLAGLPDDEVAARYEGIELPSLTRRSLTTIEGLLAELDLVRKRGFALDNEELEDGLGCVAVPVANVFGQVSHAVALSGPASRVMVNVPSLVDMLTTGVRELAEHVSFLDG